jgi:glycerate kinase
VAAAAARAGASVVAVVGRSTLAPERLRPLGVDAVHTLSQLEPDAASSMRHAAELLETTAERIAAAWLRDRPERTAP